MLKEILSPETCGKCRGCCYFDNEDLWEVPTITPFLADYIKTNLPQIKLKSEKDFSVYYFDMEYDNKEKLYTCNALSEKGCILGEMKPFDCKIWPFRLMKDEKGEIKIAVAKYCKPVSEITKQKLEKFLLESGLLRKIDEYKAKNKFSIKEYSKDYIFLDI